MKSMVRLLSRKSPLAIFQVEEVLHEFEKRSIAIPDVERNVIDSFGDKHKELSLLDGQAGDFFTREIDQAVLNGEADVGIHSAKDLSFPLAKGLKLFALTGPADQRDALVGKTDASLETLAPGARVGTSSPTRKAYVQHIRPDLQTLSIRGTIEERLAQLDAGDFDAVIVAACALDRLSLSHRISSYLAAETHPLQGYLAVVGRARDYTTAEIFRLIDVRRTWGQVCIAGAGPGDPELLTLKTRSRIDNAEVIFHDALLSPKLLEGSPAELIFVGKRRGRHEMTQDQINERLYRAALSGKRVLRLKGGDPLLFGRGSEEAVYLRERLIAVELVPGVSAAFAAANYAGIPLTERAVSTGVSLLTGWPAEALSAPKTDTAVYYMGGGSLSEIGKKQIEAGAAPDTPVAMVSNASLPEQQVSSGTLSGLLDDKEQYPTPVLVFVGETVKTRDRLDWWDERPLVWYTGTEAGRYEHRRSLEGDPCRILHVPLIRIESKAGDPIVQKSVGEIANYAWIFFTSRWAVRYYFEAVKIAGKDSRVFASAKVAAVGAGTAAALFEYGIKADLVASKESATGLLEAFDVLGGARGEQCLLPGSDQALPTLAAGLRDRGCEVQQLVVYENHALGGVEYPGIGFEEIVFTSPSTVRAYRALFGEPEKSGARIRSMGDSTSEELRNPGKHKNDRDLVTDASRPKVETSKTRTGR